MWQGGDISPCEERTDGPDVTGNGRCAGAATRQHVARGHTSESTVPRRGRGCAPIRHSTLLNGYLLCARHRTHAFGIWETSGTLPETKLVGRVESLSWGRGRVDTICLVREGRVTLAVGGALGKVTPSRSVWGRVGGECGPPGRVTFESRWEGPEGNAREAVTRRKCPRGCVGTFSAGRGPSSAKARGQEGVCVQGGARCGWSRE